MESKQVFTILLCIVFIMGVITGYSINEAYKEKLRYEKEKKELDNKTFNASYLNLSDFAQRSKISDDKY